MVDDCCMSLSDLKKKYGVLKKRYSLPSFEDLNKYATANTPFDLIKRIISTFSFKKQMRNSIKQRLNWMNSC
jgi:hypothetical protein